MTDDSGMGRRGFLLLLGVGGGAVATSGVTRIRAADARTRPLRPTKAAAAGPSAPATEIHLAGTDGFFFVPGHSGRVHPDPLAPAPLTTWGFGFRDVTGLTDSQVSAQRGHFQMSAPMLWTDENQDVKINLTNLGLSVRPDLTDSHTIHWHGFRNAIPLFDGVPELSVAVPVGRSFTYFYRPRDPGTYMYHCHFEDVEHVSMGMTGIISVRPAQNAGVPSRGIPAGKYAYNDGLTPSAPGSTSYDREWGMFLSEAWTLEHWEGAHIQEHDWSEYSADVWLLNGRSYPDTLAPNGAGRDADGGLLPPPGPPGQPNRYKRLRYQPISSLVQAMSGERILLRFVNLGFQQQSMTLAGLQMRVIGKDATLLRGRDGTDLSYLTGTIHIGPGESVDAIVVAPTVSAQRSYLLYNRGYDRLHNPGIGGLGGQLTEVRIFPTSAGLPPQPAPNF